MHFKIKKIRVLLIICFFISICFINIHSFDALTGAANGGYTTPGGGGGGGGGYWVGNYYIKADGYRVSIIDANGNLVNNYTHDYWSPWKAIYNVGNGYEFMKNPDSRDGIYNFVYYKNKMPKTSGITSKGEKITSKQYDMSGSSEEYVVASEDYYYTWLYNNHYSDAIGNVTIGLSNGYGDTIYGNNYTKYALWAFIESFKDEKKAVKMFGRILKDCGVEGSNDNQRIGKVKKYYLIVEPLLAVWTNFHTGSPYATSVQQGIVYTGTLNDIYYLGYPPYAILSDYSVYNGMAYANPIVFNTKSIKGLKACTTDDDPNSYSNRKTNLKESNGCSGAFLIELSQLLGSCDEDVKQAYSKYFNKDKAKYDSEINRICSEYSSDCTYIKSKYAKLFNLQKSSITCDYTPSCDTTAKLITTNCNSDNPDEKCTDKMNTLFGTKDYKTVISKFKNMYGLSNSLKYYVEIFNNKSVLNKNVFSNYITNKSNYCSVISCKNLLDGHKSDSADDVDYQNTLLKIFPKSIFLSKENRDAYNSGMDNPEDKVTVSCDETDIPICPAKKAEGDCSTGEIVFEDSGNENCIREGVSYNNISSLKSGNFIQQSSYKENIDGVDVFCSERVEFNFPKSVSTKSGKLLAWGNFEYADNEFGGMKIYQHCYTEKDKSLKRNTRIRWKDDIHNTVNTIVKLSYNDPNGKYTINNVQLDTKLAFVMYGKNLDTGAKGEDVGGLVQYDSIKDYEITAVYKFYYPSELTWYSSKSSESEFINERKADQSENKNSYLFIGYGFPTSFSTHDGSFEDSLVARIYNIGTSTSPTTPAKFNKYVSKELNMNDGYEYSCNYDIHNELFASECYDENGNLYENAPEYCEESVKDIDVVFRTIDLVESNKIDTTSIENEINRAFPGRSGNGKTNRNIGKNWSNPSLNDTDILNILDKNIYNKKPMYHIKLDVSLIKEIRSLNEDARKDFGVDPYNTYIVEGVSINAIANVQMGYICTDDIYSTKFCTSNFLSHLKRKGKIDGICMKEEKSDERLLLGVCGQEWWNE